MILQLSSFGTFVMPKNKLERERTKVEKERQIEFIPIIIGNDSEAKMNR